MRNPKTAIFVMATFAATMVSCKNNKNETSEKMNGDSQQMEMDSEMMNDGMHEKMMDNGKDKAQSTAIINEYLELKNALVADNSKKAAEAGGDLTNAIEEFDKSSISEAQLKEVTAILEDAKMHAEHIAENEGNMEHQREHFSILSIDVKDLLIVTGAKKTLYQAYCPMYNDGEGAIWLSVTKEIKNPYFGSKMLKCGKVQEVIQ